MKPYYDEDGISIYHGDCRDILPTLGKWDVVFTSPPYNLSDPARNKKPTGTSYSALGEGYETYGDDMPHHEYVAWQREIIGQLWDGLTDAGAIFYNHKQICRDGLARLPFELVPDRAMLRQVIHWDRGSGHIQSYWYPRVEWILLLARPDFRLNQLGVFDLWRVPFDTTSEHPAPFPIGLPTRAIVSTTAGLVLDPFAGSGTTLRAAKDLGRRAIGIELSERYCEIAAKRLAQGVLDFTKETA